MLRSLVGSEMCIRDSPTTRSLKYAKISWNIVWVSSGMWTPSAERVKQLVTFSRLSLANCIVKPIRLLQPSAHVLTASSSDREGVCQTVYTLIARQQETQMANGNQQPRNSKYTLVGFQLHLCFSVIRRGEFCALIQMCCQPYSLLPCSKSSPEQRLTLLFPAFACLYHIETHHRVL